MALGRMCRKTTRSALAPTDSDQMTNSRSRRVRNSARTSRATPIQPVSPITAMMVQIEGLRNASTARSRKKRGKTSMRSTRRMMRRVDHAAVVAGGGAEEDADGRRDADGHEAHGQRHPRRRRARARARRGRADRCRTSGCVEGGVRIFFVSGRLGSHGAISGRERSPGRPGTATTTPPHDGEPVAAKRRARTGASPRAPSRGHQRRRRAAQADARIHEAVGDVGEEVGEQRERRDDDQVAHHHRVVAREDGLHHELAHAGDGEDRLDDHAAADQARAARGRGW